jgi:DNA (cytosine-5)-methyltransferase 1
VNVLDLFSGIGGFSLGLERAGMRTVAFCEVDPFCRAVLRKHWPNVPIYEDIREDGWRWFAVDLVCGGFPCQDISSAGRRAGLSGNKSGLWSAFRRVVSESRPYWVLIENSARGAKHWVPQVRADISALGYESVAFDIAASDIGANHERNRAFVLADSCGGRCVLAAQAIQAARASSEFHSWWGSEPGVRRVDDGVPNRLDRLRALGNAVVPQIPEIIGRAIMMAA